MKDPCNKCLVSVMCSQICWDKANYGILLQRAISHSKQQINEKTSIHKYVDDFLKYNKKYKKHLKTLLTIKDRKRLLKNDHKK